MKSCCISYGSFFHISKMILIVIYDDTIFPDNWHRKEKRLSFQRNIPDDDAVHIPSGLVVPAIKILKTVQRVSLQKSTV